ncbi:CD247 antigen like isoform X3 [Anabas testudineus]|nr:CD247 antigen like isoform X3 [Anabas testudineus]
MIYCIVATALYFREKFSHLPAEVLAASTQDDKGAIYQELERPKDADPYQVLEPLKKKKRPGKKKKSQADERGDDRDRYESVDPGSAAPPVAPV